MLTPSQAFKELQISSVHGYRLVAGGKIPSRRYGRIIRIPAQWIAEQASAQPTKARGKRRSKVEASQQ